MDHYLAYVEPIELPMQFPGWRFSKYNNPSFFLLKWYQDILLRWNQVRSSCKRPFSHEPTAHYDMLKELDLRSDTQDSRYLDRVIWQCSRLYMYQPTVWGWRCDLSKFVVEILTDLNTCFHGFSETTHVLGWQALWLGPDFDSTLCRRKEGYLILLISIWPANKFHSRLRAHSFGPLSLSRMVFFIRRTLNDRKV